MKKTDPKQNVREKDITFTHKLAVKVTVKRAEFVHFSTLRYVDQARLGKGTHKVEVGYLKAPCGKRLVTAVVTRGAITRFEIDPCTDEKPVPPEIQDAVQAGARMLWNGGKSPLPVSFADFVAMRIDLGARFPCGWIIVQPNGPSAQQGVVIFCCIKIIKVGPIPIPLPVCGALPFPPKP